MLQHIISFSTRKPWLVLFLITGMALYGIFAARQLALDAVPDITNNQVQVVSNAPHLAAQEVEQYITAPLERNLANLPGMSELRSISRYGLSVITVVFEEDMPLLQARQLTRELIDKTASEIPEGMGTTELMPITTGLGEIYQYVLQVSPEKQSEYSDLELRTIQDWLVKRQLAGTPGIIEVSSFGGRVKQYELALDPERLAAFSLSVSEVFEALSENNSNSAGSYIAHRNKAFYIRTEGMMRSKEDIEQTVITMREGVPITAAQIGSVVIGSPPRYGAMTMDGKGEVVGGITLMLKDAHAYQVLENVKERIQKVQENLPEGISIYPYLDRSKLIQSTIRTVMINLLEGGLIVIGVLVLLLGNLRAGLIVGSVIPLAMLFALSLMYLFGVSANLMSLGAIDFGIVVDGAVITIEGILHTITAVVAGHQLTRKEIREVIIQSGITFIRPATFGVLIILVVFIPVLSLQGIEGKMFRPMAQTLGFALTGALLLTMTYVPAMASLLIKQPSGHGQQFAVRIEKYLRNNYSRLMHRVLNRSKMVLGFALLLLGGTLFLFTNLGSEFIPTLEEGDMAMQMSVPPGSSLEYSIANSSKAEAILKEHFPEIEHVVSKIGTAEVPTDPMGIEDADIMILLKDKKEWSSAETREELTQKMKDKLSVVDASFEFTQPIQLRFNELISGAKTDIAVKIFGDQPELLKQKAEEAAEIIREIEGAGDVKVEVTQGLQQWVVKYQRSQMQRHGVSISDLNQAIRAAFAGEPVGVIYEEERRFDLVLRYSGDKRTTPDLHQIFVKNHMGKIIPVSECAILIEQSGPSQISREQSRRRIQIGINVRGRDLGSVVEEIQAQLKSRLQLPEGYYLSYGGQYENLVRARKRLSLAVPLALLLIFVFLYGAFQSIKQSLIIFSAIPFAAIGGVWALWLRDMPFSISGGIGFIALFGVAVLNGIVMMSHLNELMKEETTDMKTTIIRAASDRLRPVLITALVAALGFLPMALSTGNGAEVQRPLATVVIGGLISSTLLTLLLLPVISFLSSIRQKNRSKLMVTILLLFIFIPVSQAQDTLYLGTEEAVLHALQNNRNFRISNLEIEKSQAERKGAFSAGNSRFEFQRGQINFEGKDNYISISQELGNPLEMLRKYQLTDQKTELRASEAAMQQHLLIYKVRSVCQHFLYQKARLQTTDSLLKRLEQAMKISVEQQKAGRISALESGLIELQYLEWQSRRITFINELYETQTELQILLASEQSVRITDIFTQIQHTGGPASRNRIFGDLVELQLRMMEKEKKLIRATQAPSIELGYFNQSLDLVPGFRGYALNLSMPVFQREIRSNYKRTEIALEQKKLETAQTLFEHEQQLRKLYGQYEETRLRLSKMQDPKSMFEHTDALLETGSRDVTETYLFFQQAYQFSLQQLELIHQLNQIILQIEFYVQP